jgi:hypothetical protein
MKKSTLFWFLVGLITILNFLLYYSGWGEKTMLYISNIIPIICALLSTIILYFTITKFKKFDYIKLAWMMILLGIVLYFLGESVYAILEIGFKVDMYETYPSVADYFWSIGYIPLFIGVIVMYNGYRKSGLFLGKKWVYVAITIFFVVILYTVIHLLLWPIIIDNETDFLAKFFYLFYPLADILLIFPTFVLIYITSLFGKGYISKPWKYLSLGFISFTFADLIYSYLVWQDLYGVFSIIDILWNFGYLLMGLAGLHQMELLDYVKEVEE